MSENYFKFKQFTIYQDNCAMKVGTDGVLLGAFANTNNCKTILDIGTGTGLIALMLAQKTNEKITAIEIDEPTFEQALYNVSNSNFSSNINLINSSIQNFAKNETSKYDLIISNPPFFQHHLKSGNKQKDIARHSETLSYEDLVKSANSLLNRNGRFCVIIPKDDEVSFIDICNKNNLYLSEILNIKPTPTKNIKRVILEFSCNDKTEVKTTELIIEINGRHDYSKEYRELTKDYYLNF